MLKSLAGVSVATSDVGNKSIQVFSVNLLTGKKKTFSSISSLKYKHKEVHNKINNLRSKSLPTDVLNTDKTVFYTTNEQKFSDVIEELRITLKPKYNERILSKVEKPESSTFKLNVEKTSSNQTGTVTKLKSVDTGRVFSFGTRRAAAYGLKVSSGDVSAAFKYKFPINGYLVIS